MKRVVVILALFAPSAILVFLSLQSQADASASLPLFHFYIVTFTAFTAVVVSILLGSILEGIARPRHMLAAVAFAAIASIFFFHGAATSGALIAYSHPAVRWSAWLTLFAGGVIFSLAGLDGPNGLPHWLSLRGIIAVTVAGVLLYLGIAIFAPQWLTTANQQGAILQPAIFLISLGLWLFAAFRFWQIWRITHNRVDGLLGLVTFWLAHAVISMHQFPVWQLSWWLYHFLLCFGFLITIYILTVEYEQALRFRLLRYYLGVALISTALLALIASYLFAEFSYRTLVTEIKSSTAALVNGSVQAVAGSLPGDATSFDRQTHYIRHLANLPLGSIALYSPEGQVFYPVDSNGGGDTLIDQARFAQALAGETVVEVHPPAEATGNNPFGAVYMVETYAPLPDGPQVSELAGILVALQAAPEVGPMIIQARRTGLMISALTMSLLFMMLLAVVGRADRLISTRTEELLRAYTNLRQAESMRDDLNHMIVHDLRNPLNVISATFELVRLTPRDEQLETLEHFWDNVYTATHRMIGLIDDILTVSKMEAGQLTPQFASTSLPELMAEVVNNFKPQALVENKQLHLDCPSPLTVELDPVLFGRVIENLVNNAFKYTEPEGIIQISVKAESECVRLSVRDNGDGVPDAYKPRIFEKFAQALGSNGQPIRKGAGLGLTFCSLVIQAHNGRIWVTDVPGGGSEFILTLPQHRT